MQVSHREIPMENNLIWERCMDLTRDLGTDWSESVLGFQNWSAKSVYILKLGCRDPWTAQSVRIFNRNAGIHEAPNPSVC